jgi:hypothetical protein
MAKRTTTNVREGKIATPAQLRNAIRRLSPTSPFTDQFRKKWLAASRSSSGQRERSDVWYDTQHEHWLVWLGQYGGPGAYGRKGTRYSAEFAYNHIVNPQMLIYLSEAVNIDRATLQAASKAAFANRRTMMAMSAAIRRVVPWQTIETALLAKTTSLR